MKKAFTGCLWSLRSPRTFKLNRSFIIEKTEVHTCILIQNEDQCPGKKGAKYRNSECVFLGGSFGKTGDKKGLKIKKKKIKSLKLKTMKKAAVVVEKMELDDLL